jgi:hypothetical protein
MLVPVLASIRWHEAIANNRRAELSTPEMAFLKD